MKKITFLLFVIFNSFITFSQTQTEKDALVALYNATNGANWTNKTNWLSELPVSQWYGVTVENGGVTQIDLYNNNLLGNLPPEIGVLTNLMFLNLNSNKLSGNIPIEFTQLINLQSFYLSNNQLAGSIPDQFGQLTQLNSFDISQNNFTGSIPASICTITNLNAVNFSYNYFDGNSCPTIKCLKDKNVSFWGTAGQPQKSGNWLTFDCNHPKVAEQDSLALIGLYNSTGGPNWTNKTNWLTSPIYKWYGVNIENGRVTQIELYNNNLSVSLPSAIGQLTNLRSLNLSSNKLSGSIPVEFTQLINLQYFSLSNNQLTSPIPEFSQFTQLYSMDISENSFTGTLPLSFCNIPLFNGANFSGNNFDDQSCPTIKCLIAKNVNFWGQPGQKQDNGYFLTLDCVPPKTSQLDSLALVALYNSTDGPNWTNKANWLTTRVYKWYGVSIENGRVIQIELGNNNMTGSLPSAIGQLTNLRYLYLSSNKLSGNIPVEFGQLTNLQNIEFSSNKLSGSLPVEFKNLINLYGLGLSNNQFTGQIPTEIGQMKNLTNLSLSDNQFTGQIPTEISQLSNLQYLILDNNQLTGNIPEQFGLLTNLTNLSLKNNDLTGLIPIELCNLARINSINFAKNNFDDQSCPVIQCLIEKEVNFQQDFMQLQKSGFSLTADCNPNITRSLVITEAYMVAGPLSYIEITNMTDSPVQLSQFELGHTLPWDAQQFQAANGYSFMLPDKLLQPGESYVIAQRSEYGPKQFGLGLEGFSERETKEDVLAVADLIIDRPEPKGGPETDDLISPNWLTTEEYAGRGCWYLKQHLSETESVVVDQVGGVFDGPNGMNIDHFPHSNAVAGMGDATGNGVLIRKFRVKSGNPDFANGRGFDKDNSEWIAVQLSNAYSPWRSAGWTVGNHGNNSLDATTLQSTVIDIDFTNKTMKVPFGVRSKDDIMNFIDKKQGIVWNYMFARTKTEDYLFQSVRTGDKLIVVVCGNEPQIATFDLIADDPGPESNIVIPVAHTDALARNWECNTSTGAWENNISTAEIDWPRVTRNVSGIDFITGISGGIPYATRTDSLLKYLEKPANASWEFVLSGGVQRADLIPGDKLKVTSENGTVKEYEIQVQPYRPSHVADLETISWPDIPQELKNTNGWNGDVIPGFVSAVFNYTVNVPYFVNGVPVLAAIPKDKKAKLKFEISSQANKNPDNKVINIQVTAEDGYTKRTYTIYLNKETTPENIQPNIAEPFLSEFIFWEQWSNSFGEICNPGSLPLDLSNYMIAMEWNPNPDEVIQSRMGTGDWLDRFDKYVPGYKWVNQAQWAITPGILVPDTKVNAIVQPGDVFCFGSIATDERVPNIPEYVWPIPGQLDVQFNNYNSTFSGKSYMNPWGEDATGSPVFKWKNSNWYLFKIKNEDVKKGLKPANDPNDFELIEWFGMDNGSDWIIGGTVAEMITNYIRKPETTKPNPVPKGSFGTNPDNSEWTWTNQAYWDNLDAGWPMDILNVGNDLGKHVFNKTTTYQSTVFSSAYRVSKGYSINETISAILTGTDAETFLANIIKGDANQTLTVSSGSNASVLNATDILSNGDVLTVVSADGKNTTMYILGVSDVGLSSNAAIVPAENSTVVVQANTITGFEYGTTLETLMENLVVPQGASVTVLDVYGNPLPFTITNYSVQNVPVYVNADMTIIVTAEDGKTELAYNLNPEFVSGQIFIGSDYFEVNQSYQVIGTVMPGTTVEQLLSNVYSIPGATIKIVDKYGFERTTGSLYLDDKLIVSFNINNYQMLKAASEPLVKEYSIFICNTPASARVKDTVLELNDSGLAQLTITDINNSSEGGCGEFWLTISKSDFGYGDLGDNYVTLAVNNYLGEVSVAQAKVTVVDIINPPLSIAVNLKVYLEASPFNTETGLVETNLRNASRIPNSQPYNIAPWSYLGSENSASIPSNIVDWVLVELRQAVSSELATSSTILAKRAAFLKSDGSIVDLDGTSPVQFDNATIESGKNLYVVVRHRNHLAVMSATGATLNNGVYSYDFTSGLSQAFGGGNGYKQVATGKYAMVVGDVDQDGNIFVSDYNAWATSFGNTNGYLKADLDMDGNVFVSDYNKWAVNFGSTINAGLKSASIRSIYFSCVPK